MTTFESTTQRPVESGETTLPSESLKRPGMVGGKSRVNYPAHCRLLAVERQGYAPVNLDVYADSKTHQRIPMPLEVLR